MNLAVRDSGICGIQFIAKKRLCALRSETSSAILEDTKPAKNLTPKRQVVSTADLAFVFYRRYIVPRRAASPVPVTRKGSGSYGNNLVGVIRKVVRDCDR